MTHPVRNIKLAQKESLLLREISRLFMEKAMDDEQLRQVTINRVELAPSKAVCTVFFYTPEGAAAFREILEHLKLYKPSLRSAIAKKLDSRYVPDLVFKFDETFEKEFRIDQILQKIKDEDKS